MQEGNPLFWALSRATHEIVDCFIADFTRGNTVGFLPYFLDLKKEMKQLLRYVGFNELG
jgi:hypothetical protein